MPKRALPRLILGPLNEGDLLSQIAPELSVVLVLVWQAIVVHLEIEVRTQQLTKVDQPDVDVAAVSLGQGDVQTKTRTN
jgi:hypothetical protein